MIDLFGRLATAYPQLRRFMGEDAFQRAALTHIDLEAPHVRSLDHYAAHFTETLRTEYPHLPQLHELAWLEYVLGAPHNELDETAMSSAMIEKVWGGMPLQFSSTLLVREFATNAVKIWEAMRDGVPRPAVELLAEPCRALVWRSADSYCLRSICALEHEAVRHIQASGSITSLCDMLADRMGKQAAEEQASALLAGWASNKMLARQQYWEF